MKKYVVLRPDFDFNKIEIDLDINYNYKPLKVFWASPKDSDFGWIQWLNMKGSKCINLDDSCLHTFHLKNDSKVLSIENRSDIDSYLDNYLIPDKYTPKRKCIDYEKLAKDYDALELCDASIGHDYLDRFHQSYWIFYNWDCESICILNKDIIEMED